MSASETHLRLGICFQDGSPSGLLAQASVPRHRSPPPHMLLEHTHSMAASSPSSSTQGK